MKAPEQESRDRIALLFRAAAERKKSVLLLCEGADLLAIKRFISQMNQILDPRHYRVMRSTGVVSEGRPFLHRYWVNLPPGGDLLICEHAYYHELILGLVTGDIGRKRYRELLQEVRFFEEDMAADGLLLLKFLFPGSPWKIRRDFQKKISGTHREPILRKRYKAVIESSPRYQEHLHELTGSGEGAAWTIIAEDAPDGMAERARDAVLSHLEKHLEIDSLSAVRSFDEAMDFMRRRSGGDGTT
ncbi:MAG: hypothetical protein HY042_11340 [Spirochaetia bacterium]|nr:hypothetical protein [Spirochaetia bacterium]